MKLSDTGGIMDSETVTLLQ